MIFERKYFFKINFNMENDFSALTTDIWEVRKNCNTRDKFEEISNVVIYCKISMQSLI